MVVERPALSFGYTRRTSSSSDGCSMAALPWLVSLSCRSCNMQYKYQQMAVARLFFSSFLAGPRRACLHPFDLPVCLVCLVCIFSPAWAWDGSRECPFFTRHAPILGDLLLWSRDWVSELAICAQKKAFDDRKTKFKFSLAHERPFNLQRPSLSHLTPQRQIRIRLCTMSSAELAVSYAALILADEDIEITVSAIPGSLPSQLGSVNT